MQTKVCAMLGIEFPILAFSHCRDVVAAVTKAGGMGVLGVTAHTPEQLEIDCAWIEKEIGSSKSYGIDVIIPQNYTGREEGGLSKDALAAMIPAEHKVFVNELLSRYGVAPLPEDEVVPTGEGSWSHKGAQPLVGIALSRPIRLIVNALGPPPAELVDAAHRADVHVAALIGAKQHAARQKAAGVDIIVAQGYEAGGHTGEIATMVLIPEVVDVVGDTPVTCGRRYCAGSSNGGSDGARRPGGVDGIGVAHHGGSRDAPCCEAKVPRCVIERHCALAGQHGEAGSATSHRVDR